jgi:diacylglycerol kinase family enzyme
MVVQGRSRARLFALALNAVARGVDSVEHTPQFDSFIVDRFRISMNGIGKVAVDGEILSLTPPLEYELRREALTVVCPPADIPLAEVR